MIAAFIIIVGYDIVVYSISGESGTISAVSRKLYAACPAGFVAFVFWLGVLVGHLKFPMGD